MSSQSQCSVQHYQFMRRQNLNKYVYYFVTTPTPLLLNFHFLSVTRNIALCLGLHVGVDEVNKHHDHQHAKQLHPHRYPFLLLRWPERGKSKTNRKKKRRNCMGLLSLFNLKVMDIRKTCWLSGIKYVTLVCMRDERIHVVKWGPTYYSYRLKIIVNLQKNSQLETINWLHILSIIYSYWNI